jgi:hypothetical protein
VFTVPGFLYRAIVIEDMAGTGAISQFADGVFSVRVFGFFMRAGFIVVRVTASTVGLETGCSIGSGLTIALMAIQAADAGPMVSRIITR